CAVGVQNDQHPLVKAYHQLLVWDITSRPLPLRLAEAVLAPVIGKSLVIYARKPEAA
ncbi:MAG: SAM-dependent methyltransferase, partial [Actinobacteria bacterium]|nr:SAM-dependent methyltransferase [Actinomycetota bacterium]